MLHQTTWKKEDVLVRGCAHDDCCFCSRSIAALINCQLGLYILSDLSWNFNCIICMFVEWDAKVVYVAWIALPWWWCCNLEQLLWHHGIWMSEKKNVACGWTIKAHSYLKSSLRSHKVMCTFYVVQCKTLSRSANNIEKHKLLENIIIFPLFFF